MPQNLDPSLRTELDAVFREAIAKTKSGEKDEAIRLAEGAWEGVPEPKFQWDVTWSYTRALAKVYRDTGHFNQALDLLDKLYEAGAVQPHQDGPPFLMGTIYFEMGDLVNAKKWLGDANRISNGRCFREEPKKYKDALLMPA